MAVSRSSWLCKLIKQQSWRIIRVAQHFRQRGASSRNKLFESIPSKADLRAGFASELDKLRNESASQLRGGAIAILTLLLWYLFGIFFDTSSVWFFVGVALLLIISVSFITKHYITGCVTVVGLLALIVALPFTTTYRISSDHFRFRYRVIDNISYFEYPGRLTVLNWLAKSLARDRLITVEQCDGTNVAVLPLLPYKPLYLSDNVITPIGHRRFPDLTVDNFTMNIGASVDGPSAMAPHGSFGVKFGFNSGQRSIRLTYIFPRSSGCQRRRVPLLPVLEVLPWYPDDTRADSGHLEP